MAANLQNIDTYLTYETDIQPELTARMVPVDLPEKIFTHESSLISPSELNTEARLGVFRIQPKCVSIMTNTPKLGFTCNIQFPAHPRYAASQTGAVSRLR